MSEEGIKRKSGGGCLGKLATFVAMTGLAGLGAALYFISQPQDLSDIEGRGGAALGKKSRDLSAVLANSLKGGYAVTLTEEEINLHLRDTLAMKQGGLLADQVSLEDVAVRLEDGRAEVIILREVAGYPFTISMYLQILQTEQADGTVVTQILRNGGPYREDIQRPMVGGRFGQVPVPESYVGILAGSSFAKLAGVYRNPGADRAVREIDFIEEMARIRIEDGKLVLDPRPDMGGIPGSF